MGAEGNPNELRIIKDEAVSSLMEARHILDDDVKQVIHNAEVTGEKLYQADESRYLAKMRLSEATFYVEYSVTDDGYVVHTAYSHMSEIVEDN
jgi:glutamate synthase (NADPH/NADH) small chain